MLADIHRDQFCATALHKLRMSAGNAIVSDDCRDIAERANGLTRRTTKLGAIDQQYNLTRSGHQSAFGLQQYQVCLH